MYAVFNFPGQQLTSQIIIQGFQKVEVLYNNLQASDGSLTFSIPFSTDFCEALASNINADVNVVIHNSDSTVYASGFIKKEAVFTQQYRNEPIRLTIISPSYLLDKTLDDSYALENRTVAYIVSWLLLQAGFRNVGDLTALSDVIPLFVFNSGDNIKTVLKELCFEYGKTFIFDKDGYFQIADLFVSSFVSSQTFTRDNIRGEIEIKVKESEADCIRGRWKPVTLEQDTLVFEDNQGRTNAQDCNIEIAANSYFGGMKDNFLTCDSTLGEVQMIKAITHNNIVAESGVNITLNLEDRAKLDQVHFTAQNTTSSVKKITRMQILADAYICKETREDVSTYGEKEKAFDLKYIQTTLPAQRIVKALADYYHATNFTIGFSSLIDCPIGALITVNADGIANYNCRIIRKTRQLSRETIEYECENIGEYTPSAIAISVQTPLVMNAAIGIKGLDGQNGGYQDYQFAVGNFGLTDQQARQLTWYDAPPTVGVGQCLYMATKFIEGE